MTKLLKVSILCFCWLLAQSSIAQEHKNAYRYQLSIDTDNDAFIHWENYDRYYTYGVGFKVSFLADSLLGVQKWFPKKEDHFYAIGLRSEAYTPTHLQRREPEEGEENDTDFDRPFAGLLYGTVEANYVFKNSYARFELLAGLMGPSALSGDIQQWIHDNIVVGGDVEGWAYQIPDQFIMNLNGTYGIGIPTKWDWIEPYTKADLRLGNLYVDAGATLGLRIGRFRPYNRSISARNGWLGPRKRSVFYYQATVSATAVAFDGTAQGKLFARPYEYAIEDLSHIYGSMTHGLYWGNSRMVIGFDVTVNYSKVIPRSRHIYGRIDFRYRFL